LHPALTGKAGAPPGQYAKFADFLYSLRFAYQWSKNRSVNSIGAVFLKDTKKGKGWNVLAALCLCY
jgi:hypothetical protein